eukprot:CAMPEP_0115765678 /NCGR_PEP_ID=MMETSP0272-20121206/102719_1 /TAXON_ID=71861 /ORGANISM="Scrippsiella trochoidea, Strain CCMP3099" /LENGTH=171 /DNA_ID=CAMNT_0003211543 /DNA_START=207 /DNA_END=721 /DNA_ORIENTATION=+
MCSSSLDDVDSSLLPVAPAARPTGALSSSSSVVSVELMVACVGKDDVDRDLGQRAEKVPDLDSHQPVLHLPRYDHGDRVLELPPGLAVSEVADALVDLARGLLRCDERHYLLGGHRRVADDCAEQGLRVNVRQVVGEVGQPVVRLIMQHPQNALELGLADLRDAGDVVHDA